MTTTYLRRWARWASLHRVVQVVVAAGFMASVWVMGCGAKVAVDLDGGTNGTGGEGGGGVGVGGGAVDGGPCGLTQKDAGMGQLKLPECFAMPSNGCPKQYEAPQFIVPTTPCVYLVSVDCGPIVQGSQCCYMVTEEMKPCN